MVRKNYMKQQDLPLKEDPLVGAQAAVAGPTQPTPEQKKELLHFEPNIFSKNVDKKLKRRKNFILHAFFNL